MARGYLKWGVGTNCDRQRIFMAQQGNARRVRGEIKSAVYETHGSESRIGAGAFEYDFGALEDTDNKFTKSYTNMTYGSLPF